MEINTRDKIVWRFKCIDRISSILHSILSWTKFSLVARLFQLKYELWSAKMLLSLYPDFLQLIPKIIFVCDGIPFLRNNQLIIFAIRPNFVSWNELLKICSHKECLYQILKWWVLEVKSADEGVYSPYLCLLNWWYTFPFSPLQSFRVKSGDSRPVSSLLVVTTACPNLCEVFLTILVGPVWLWSSKVNCHSLMLPLNFPLS